MASPTTSTQSLRKGYSKKEQKENKKEIKRQIDLRYTDCSHRMVAKTAMPGQDCAICSALIWGVHKQSMKCMHCGMVTHIKCLPNLKPGSPLVNSGCAWESQSPQSPRGSQSLGSQSPLSLQGDSSQESDALMTPTSPGECPSHVLQKVTLLKPTWCCVCQDFIWGIVKQGLTCMVCGRYYHHKCGEGLEKDSVRKLKKEADMQRREYEEFGKSDAYRVLKALLSDFSKRWSTMDKVKLASPLGLVYLGRVFSRHSKQYDYLPERFPVFKDYRATKKCSVAMLYAKAVYGVAYSNGHLSTVGSAFRMHTVLKPFKNVGCDVTSHDNDVASLQALDVLNNSSREIVVSDWSNKVYQPAFAVYADHSEKLVILAIRGTVSKRDTLTDLAAESTQYLGGEAHVGIVKCTEHLWSKKHYLDEAHAKYPDYNVIVTGHSLGGAVATLFSIKARENAGEKWEEQIECFSFGSPPTVSGEIVERLNKAPHYITSVVCGLDAVPRTSLTNLERLAREVAGFGEEQLHENCPYTRLHIPGTLLLLHDPPRYGKPPDTKVYHMPHVVSTHDVASTVERNPPPKKEEKTTARQTTHWAIARLFVSRHMIGDHLPDRYHDSLEYWCEKLQPFQDIEPAVTLAS